MLPELLHNFFPSLVWYELPLLLEILNNKQKNFNWGAIQTLWDILLSIHEKIHNVELNLHIQYLNSYVTITLTKTDWTHSFCHFQKIDAIFNLFSFLIVLSYKNGIGPKCKIFQNSFWISPIFFFFLFVLTRSIVITIHRWTKNYILGSKETQGCV